MIFDRIIKKSPIDKGWSGDAKYCAIDGHGNKYLLRVSPIERYERRKLEFQRMKQVAELGIAMGDPVEFGICGEGVYRLERWIQGRDAEEVVMQLSEKDQYAYGLEAGNILKKLHSLPPPENALPWESRFNAKIDRKIALYKACSLKYEGGEAFLTYLSQHRWLLKDRPQSWQHGDYHIGNMMIDDVGVLTIIDFDRDDYGDPWEEFNRIVWCAQVAPAFASGLVDGYFGAEIPELFWRLLALYICSNTLSSLSWAIPFGEQQVDVIKKQAQDILSWYDGMRIIIPTWYGPMKKGDLCE